MVLLVNEINPNIFCFVTCFLFIFTHETLPHRGLLHTIFCIAYVRICRRYLPWLFAVRICRGFFVYISESFFVYVSKSCLYGGKSFLYVCKTFWFVRFSLLTLFLLVIVVAIMGHRRTPMLWANLPEKYKTATSLDSFKTKIKTWKCETCFGRLCRTYQQNLGFYKKYFFQ